jgi:hypothetical protein
MKALAAELMLLNFARAPSRHAQELVTLARTSFRQGGFTDHSPANRRDEVRGSPSTTLFYTMYRASYIPSRVCRNFSSLPRLN